MYEQNCKIQPRECLKKKTKNLNVLKMQTKSLTKDIEIDYVIKDQWSFPLHKHTHHEIQFILRGQGLHFINQDQFVYNAGDIFITLPQDNHSFVFQKKTAVCIVKFNEAFIQHSFQHKDLELLKSGLSYSNKKILLTTDCRKNIGELIHLLMKTYKKSSPYKELLLKNTLSLILTLLMDEAELKLSKPQDEKIQEILKYIQRHLGQKDPLSVQNISQHFNINKTYFTQYFKKATGSTYKKYVQEYTLNIIAHQLLHQDKTLSQLAYDYGFSDEAHLSRSFKSLFQKSPTAFKKSFTS